MASWEYSQGKWFFMWALVNSLVREQTPTPEPPVRLPRRTFRLEIINSSFENRKFRKISADVLAVLVNIPLDCIILRRVNHDYRLSSPKSDGREAINGPNDAVEAKKCSNLMTFWHCTWEPLLQSGFFLLLAFMPSWTCIQLQSDSLRGVSSFREAFGRWTMSVIMLGSEKRVFPSSKLVTKPQHLEERPQSSFFFEIVLQHASRTPRVQQTMRLLSSKKSQERFNQDLCRNVHQFFMISVIKSLSNVRKSSVSSTWLSIYGKDERRNWNEDQK